MINKLWSFFIVIGIMFSIVNGTTNNINTTIIKTSNEALNIFLSIIPNIILFSGIMNILKESGLVYKIAKLFNKLINKLFNNIDDETTSYIVISFILNIIGLSSASTPFTLKALTNMNKGSINSNIITFIVLNISLSSLIPTTILSLRNEYNSSNISLVMLPIFITSIIVFIMSLILNKVFKRVYD